MSFAIHLATPAPFYTVHNDKSSPLRLPDTVVCRSKRRRTGCAVLDKSSATTAGRVNMTVNSGCTGWLQPLPDLLAWAGTEMHGSVARPDVGHSCSEHCLVASRTLCLWVT